MHLYNAWDQMPAGGRGASVSACAVAMLFGRSCMCLEKTLAQQLQATGGRWWGDTTPCTVNWCKKVRGA